MSASVFLPTISLKRGSGLRCNTAQQEAATERKGIKKQKAEEVETSMPSTRGHDWCWLWYHSHALSLEERKCQYVSSFFCYYKSINLRIKRCREYYNKNRWGWEGELINVYLDIMCTGKKP